MSEPLLIERTYPKLQNWCSLARNAVYKNSGLAMNKQQQDFLERLALRIPRLFEAIAQGNVKSEYIIGVRYIGARHVRLKLVAEVVDPGANPLATHGQMKTDSHRSLRSVDMSVPNSEAGCASPGSVNDLQDAGTGDDATAPDAGDGQQASRRRRSRKR